MQKHSYNAITRVRILCIKPFNLYFRKKLSFYNKKVIACKIIQLIFAANIYCNILFK